MKVSISKQIQMLAGNKLRTFCTAVQYNLMLFLKMLQKFVNELSYKQCLQYFWITVYCDRHEIKSRITMAKAAYKKKKKKKILVTRKFDLNLRKKLLKFCIWSITL
jgi:hypothetical protein